MDKILEKIGIYNLLAVLFVGVVNLTFSILVLKHLYGVILPDIESTYDWAVLLIVGYVVGLIFQESGSLFQDICLKNNQMLLKALETSSNSRTRLTDFEKQGIYTYVEPVIGTDNDNVVYNYCRFYVMKHCNTTGIERDQSLSAMSRSFFLYFAFLPICMVLFCIIACPVSIWIWVLILFASMAISILMYRRYVRFAVLRYVNIYKNFYYYAVLNLESHA